MGMDTDIYMGFYIELPDNGEDIPYFPELFEDEGLNINTFFMPDYPDDILIPNSKRYWLYNVDIYGDLIEIDPIDLQERKEFLLKEFIEKYSDYLKIIENVTRKPVNLKFGIVVYSM